jgi:hypothetical protein
MIDFSAVMEVLKNGSDQDIVAGMKAGSIPSQMAIAELQDRAKVRTASAGQPPQEGMQEASQMNAQVGPQQDVATQPQMAAPPKVQGMAAGGLVSFKHGGEVRGFAEGSKRTPLVPNYFDYAVTGGEPPPEFYDLAPVHGFSQSALSPNGSEGDILNGDYRAKPRAATKLTPYDYTHFSETRYGLTPNGPKKTGASGAWDDTGAVTPKQTAKQADKQIPTEIPMEQPALGGGISARVGGGGGMGTGGLRSINIAGPERVAGVDYSPYMPDMKEDFGAKYDKEVGTNEGLVKREGRIADKEAALARDSDRAPWLALMKAGLGMASSKNRSLFGAAGEGGIAGLNDYTSAQADLNRRDDALFDRRSSVEDATRAEKLARFGYVDKNEGDRAKVQREVGIMGVNSRHADDTHYSDQKYTHGFNQATMNQRQNDSDMDNRYKMASLQVQRAQAAKLSDYETFLKLSANDPTNYKVVTKDGKQVRILDQAKVTNDFKSYGKTNPNALDDDTILRTLQKGVMDGSIAPGTTFSDYKASLSGGAGANVLRFDAKGNPI